MKRVRRLYRLEGLQLRYRVRRRKHVSLHRGIPLAASRAHERWSMDFSMVRSAWATTGSIPEALTTTTRVYLSGLFTSGLVDALAIRGNRTRPNKLVS
jgi:hypothetical protein